MPAEQKELRTVEAVTGSDFSTIDVKERHKNLYAEAIKFGKTSHLGEDEFTHLDEINQLFSDMKRMSKQIEINEDFSSYNWLEKAASDWQEFFSFVLSEPRNIRDEIKLPARPKNLPRSQERSVISFDQNIRALAYRIGERRKMTALKRSILEFEKNPQLLHLKFPSSETESSNDWYSATRYFAMSVLTGGINLVYNLGLEAYHQLEKIYLEDIKRLDAIHIWQNRGGGWGLDEMKDDYQQACRRLNQMMYNPKIKAPAADFSYISAYLMNTYNIGGNNISPGDALWDLIQVKAGKLWEHKGCPEQSAEQMNEDWSLAEEFVRKFYLNIIPAIEGKTNTTKQQSIKEILPVLNGIWRQSDIINCFEAAVTIYFLDPEIIRNILGNENQYDML